MSVTRKVGHGPEKRAPAHPIAHAHIHMITALQTSPVPQKRHGEETQYPLLCLDIIGALH